MGRLTLDELKSEVRANLGNRTDLDDRLTSIANLGQDAIARAIDPDSLRGMVTGTLSVTASAANDRIIQLLSAANIRKIYSLRIIDKEESLKLKYINAREADQLFPDATYYARGTPTYYTVWGDQIELWRIPDEEQEYELRVCKWPTTLSSGDEKSDLDELDDAIIYWMTWYCFKSLGNQEKAQMYQDMISSALTDSRNEDRTKPDLDIEAFPDPRYGRTSSAEYWLDPFVRGVS